MDLKKKVTVALRKHLRPELIDLMDDDDDISGFVVAPQFRLMESIDRQTLIEQALGRADPPLTQQEARRVLAIAALTPEEYAGLDGPGKRARNHNNSA
jgi:hypothetical protein